jgi:TRAP-type C4-dicarboxylate transport system substrate-binding protein
LPNFNTDALPSPQLAEESSKKKSLMKEIETRNAQYEAAIRRMRSLEEKTRALTSQNPVKKPSNLKQVRIRSLETPFVMSGWAWC